MTNVSFAVKSIEDARKAGCAVISIKFNNGPQTYTYVRKFNLESEPHHYSAVIDGCKVVWDEDKNVTSIERIYETKGYRKTSTEKQVGKNSKKTKNELEPEASEEETTTETSEETTETPVETTTTETPAEEEVEETGEIHHEKYDQIKTCLECNIPVYLAGPAGSGKNFTVEQIAKELGWNFYFSNSVQQEYKLTGFIDAGGDFHETEFYKACTDDHDCVFFLDEMDASIPEVLVLLNAAIANGYFEFPNGRVDFSHVHFVAAGNTVGSGADDMYTGRMVLDQATLDRFAIIEFDYSVRVEKSLTHNNKELIEFIHQLRAEAHFKGIRATFSYRCMTMVTKLENAGMDLVTAISISIVKGMDHDTINTFNVSGDSKYHKAFRQVQRAA